MTRHNSVLLLLVLQGVLVTIAEQDPSLGFNPEPFVPSRHKVWNSSKNFQEYLKESACTTCVPGQTNCCNQNHGTVVETSISCPQMIASSSASVSESTSFDLYCNSYDDCQTNKCEWTLPDGKDCLFTQGQAPGTACSVDSSVSILGNLSSVWQGCSIRISSANANSHIGVWTCRTTNVVVYIDTITVELNNGIVDRPVTLTAGTIMGIAIPVGLLLIAAIVIVIICCFFPSCCAGLRRQSTGNEDETGCCGRKKKDGGTRTQTSHYTEPRRPTTTSPPPPIRLESESHQRAQPQVPTRPSYSRATYEIEEESDSSFNTTPQIPTTLPGQRKTGYQPNVSSSSIEPVMYTQVRTESGLVNPGSHMPKTARKISNTTSLHSFAVPPRQNMTKKTSVM